MDWKQVVDQANKVHRETINHTFSWLCLPLKVSKNFLGLLGITPTPVPGEDAQWVGFCENCYKITNGTDDMTLHASVGGFRNNGISHCYSCGTEKEIQGFRDKDIDMLKLSCKYHWDKYPLIPYNWHTLNETERFQLLGVKNEDQLSQG